MISFSTWSAMSSSKYLPSSFSEKRNHVEWNCYNEKHKTIHFTFLHGIFFWHSAVEAQKEVLHSVAIVSRISCFGWLLKRASTYWPTPFFLSCHHITLLALKLSNNFIYIMSKFFLYLLDMNLICLWDPSQFIGDIPSISTKQSSTFIFILALCALGICQTLT